ncbi:FAD-dependent oxidoreductase [Actinoplanes lobatus]|uniref:FAD-dependent oxidoreductase n=1 Tax=Actinoplanes lobatus TaxID=113568 RepID=A0A7W7HIC4_9ACTN|nr:FAD-dependent monooxygenase [Actinoplanes lobatus]MBB4751085.1 2-polyprenyl-6-methoxyphenol hydroxylase-like FAD-dependent oxidoreductase [Actinoplanes lobatus]GGN92581.1 FAD-dependent oxidoreductase [Actinoplanes lobatus]GIE44963.1 FAD-dependent oxidoreductase [Actinoplanes lobatus]
MTTSRVLVVGGGITGGVLALGLAQRGVRVILAELRGALGGVGHGITLQGNALQAFHTVGIYDELAEHGFAFGKLRMFRADGVPMMEMPTPPMGGDAVPPTMGALRADLADILARRVVDAGVDVRLGCTVTALDDRGDHVVATLSDGTEETVDLVVGADGIRSRVRSMIGIDAQPKPVGMGIWRVVAKRPDAMDCSGLYYGGPKYKAGYTPISDSLCYAFLLEENLDRSFVGEHPNGKIMKEHGQGYGGIWGQVRDSLADDAIVNYQHIEAILIDGPWHRGRVIVIGDAAHACPPLIAQGAAMCAEDAVVLAEMLTAGPGVDEVLPAFHARRFPRVRMVLDNSLTLAQWEIHPDTPGADPGRIMGQTLGALCAPA